MDENLINNQAALAAAQQKSLAQSAYQQGYEQGLLQNTYAGNKAGLDTEAYDQAVSNPAAMLQNAANTYGADPFTYFDLLSQSNALQANAGAGRQDANALVNYDAPLSQDIAASAKSLIPGTINAIGSAIGGLVGTAELLGSPDSFFSDKSLSSAFDKYVLGNTTTPLANAARDYLLEDTAFSKVQKADSELARVSKEALKRHYGLRELQGNSVSAAEKLLDSAFSTFDTMSAANLAVSASESAPNVAAALLSGGLISKGAKALTGAKAFKNLLSSDVRKAVEKYAESEAEDFATNQIKELTATAEKESLSQQAINTAKQAILDQKDVQKNKLEQAIYDALEHGDDATKNKIINEIAEKNLEVPETAQQDATFLSNAFANEVDKAKKGIEKADFRAALAGNSISNAMLTAPDAGQSATQLVDQTSTSDLYRYSPIFTSKVLDYMNQGFSREDAEIKAREDVKTQAYSSAFREGLALGAVSNAIPQVGSKFVKVGQGAITNSLAKAESPLLKSIRENITEAGKEAVQEFGEEATTQYIANRAARDTADTRIDAMDDVGQAGYIGAVAGAYTSGVMGTPRSALALKQTIKNKAVANAIRKSAKPEDIPSTQSTVNEVKNTFSTKSISDMQYSTKNPANSVENAVAGMFNPKAYEDYKKSLPKGSVPADDNIGSALFAARNALSFRSSVGYASYDEFSKNIDEDIDTAKTENNNDEVERLTKLKNNSDLKKAFERSDQILVNVVSTFKKFAEFSYKAKNNIDVKAEVSPEKYAADFTAFIKKNLGITSPIIFRKLFRNLAYSSNKISSIDDTLFQGYSDLIKSNPELQTAWNLRLSRIEDGNTKHTKTFNDLRRAFRANFELNLFKLGKDDPKYFKNNPKEKARFDALYQSFEENLKFINESISKLSSVGKEVNATDVSVSNDNIATKLSTLMYVKALMYDQISVVEGEKSVQHNIITRWNAWREVQRNKYNALTKALQEHKQDLENNKTIEVSWNSMQAIPSSVDFSDASTLDALNNYQRYVNKTSFTKVSALKKYIKNVADDLERMDKIDAVIQKVTQDSFDSSTQEKQKTEDSTTEDKILSSENIYTKAIKNTLQKQSNTNKPKTEVSSNKPYLYLDTLTKEPEYKFLNPKAKVYKENNIPLADIRVATITPYVKNAAEYANLSYKDALSKAEKELGKDSDIFNQMLFDRDENLYKAFMSLANSSPKYKEALIELAPYSIETSQFTGSNFYWGTGVDSKKADKFSLTGLDTYSGVITRVSTELASKEKPSKKETSTTTPTKNTNTTVSAETAQVASPILSPNNVEVSSTIADTASTPTPSSDSVPPGIDTIVQEAQQVSEYRENLLNTSEEASTKDNDTDNSIKPITDVVSEQDLATLEKAHKFNPDASDAVANAVTSRQVPQATTYSSLDLGEKIDLEDFAKFAESIATNYLNSNQSKEVNKNEEVNEDISISEVTPENKQNTVTISQGFSGKTEISSTSVNSLPFVATPLYIDSLRESGLSNVVDVNDSRNFNTSMLHKDTAKIYEEFLRKKYPTLTKEQIDSIIQQYESKSINTIGASTDEAPKSFLYNHIYKKYLNSCFKRKYKKQPTLNTYKDIISYLKNNDEVPEDSGFEQDLNSLFRVLGITELSGKYSGRRSIFSIVFAEYLKNAASQQKSKDIISSLLDAKYISPVFASSENLFMFLGAMSIIPENGRATLTLPESTQTKLGVAAYLFLTGIEDKLFSYSLLNPDKAASPAEKARILRAVQRRELDITTISDIAIEAIENAFNIEAKENTQGAQIVSAFAQFLVTSLNRVSLDDATGTEFRQTMQFPRESLLKYMQYNNRVLSKGTTYKTIGDNYLKVYKIFKSNFASSSFLVEKLYKQPILYKDSSNAVYTEENEMPNLIFDSNVSEKVVSPLYMKSSIKMTDFQKKAIIATNNISNYLNEDLAEYFLASKDLELEVRGLNVNEDALEIMDSKSASSLRSKANLVQRRSAHIQNLLNIVRKKAKESGKPVERIPIHVLAQTSITGRIFPKEPMNTTSIPFLRTIFSPVRTHVMLTDKNMPTLEKNLQLALFQAHDVKLNSFENMQQEYIKKYQNPLKEFYDKYEKVFNEDLLKSIPTILREHPEINKEFYYLMNSLGVNLNASLPIVACMEQIGLFRTPFKDRLYLDTALYFELDGMTNGPSNATLYSWFSPVDIARIDSLNSSGVYPGTDTDAAVFKSDKEHNRDKYEIMAENTKNIVQNNIDILQNTFGLGRQFINILKFIFNGQFAFKDDADTLEIQNIGRSFTKLIATPISYTAGMKATAVNIVDQVDSGVRNIFINATSNFEDLKKFYKTSDKKKIYNSLVKELFGEKFNNKNEYLNNTLESLLFSYIDAGTAAKLSDEAVKNKVKEQIGNTILFLTSIGDFITLIRGLDTSNNRDGLEQNIQEFGTFFLDYINNKSTRKISPIYANISEDLRAKQATLTSLQAQASKKNASDSIKKQLETVSNDVKELQLFIKVIDSLSYAQNNNVDIYKQDAVTLVDNLASGKNTSLINELNLLNFLLFQNTGLNRNFNQSNFKNFLDKLHIFNTSFSRATDSFSQVSSAIQDYFNVLFSVLFAKPFYEGAMSVFGNDNSVYMNFAINSSEAMYNSLVGILPTVQSDYALRLMCQYMRLSPEQTRYIISNPAARKEPIYFQIPISDKKTITYEGRITSTFGLRISVVDDNSVSLIGTPQAKNIVTHSAQPATYFLNSARSAILSNNIDYSLYDENNSNDKKQLELLKNIKPFFTLYTSETKNGKITDNRIPVHNQVVYSSKRTIDDSFIGETPTEFSNMNDKKTQVDSGVKSLVTKVDENGNSSIELAANKIPINNENTSTIVPGTNGSGNAVNNNIATGDSLQINKFLIDNILSASDNNQKPLEVINAFDGEMVNLENIDKASKDLNKNNYNSWFTTRIFDDRLLQLLDVAKALINNRDILAKNNIVFPIPRDKGLEINSICRQVHAPYLSNNNDEAISDRSLFNTFSVDEQIDYLLSFIVNNVSAAVSHTACIQALNNMGGVVEQYTGACAKITSKQDARDFRTYFGSADKKASEAINLPFENNLDNEQKKQLAYQLEEERKKQVNALLKSIKEDFKNTYSSFSASTPINNKLNNYPELIKTIYSLVDNNSNIFKSAAARDFSRQEKIIKWNEREKKFKKSHNIPYENVHYVVRNGYGRYTQNKKVLDIFTNSSKQSTSDNIDALNYFLLENVENKSSSTTQRYDGLSENDSSLSHGLQSNLTGLNPSHITKELSIQDFLNEDTKESKGFFSGFKRFIRNNFARLWGLAVSRKINQDPKLLEDILKEILSNSNFKIRFVTPNKDGKFVFLNGEQYDSNFTAFVQNNSVTSNKNTLEFTESTIYVNTKVFSSIKDPTLLHQVISHEITHALTFSKLYSHYMLNNASSDEKTFINNLESYYKIFSKTSDEIWNSLPNVQKFSYVSEFIARILQGDLKYTSLNSINKTSLGVALYANVFKIAYAPIVKLAKNLIGSDNKIKGYNDAILNIVSLMAVNTTPNTSEVTAQMTRPNSLETKLASLPESSTNAVNTVTLNFSGDNRIEVEQKIKNNANTIAARALTVGFNIPQERFNEFTRNLTAFSMNLQEISPYNASLLSSQYAYILDKNILTPAQKAFLLDSQNLKIDGLEFEPENLLAAIASVDASLQRKLLNTPLFTTKRLQNVSVDNVLTNVANSIIDLASARTDSKRVSIGTLYNDSLANITEAPKDAPSGYFTENLSSKVNELLSAALHKQNKRILIPLADKFTKNAFSNFLNASSEDLLQLTSTFLKLPEPMFSMLKDLVGRTNVTAPIYALLKQSKSIVQHVRELYLVALPVKLNKAFENVLTESDWRKLDKGLGNLGIANIPLDSIYKAFTDSSYLNYRLKELSKVIPSDSFTQTHINSLVKFINTGEYTNGMRRNAYAIAHRVGAENEDLDEEFSKDSKIALTNAIDEYISLKAIQTQSKEQKELINRMLKANSSKFKELLSFIQQIEKKDLEQESLKNIIKFNQWKGFLPKVPVNNHDISIMGATEKEKAAAAKLGWTFVKEYDGPGKYGWYTRSFKDTSIFNQGAMQIVYPSVGGINTSTGLTQGNKGGAYSVRAYNSYTSKNPNKKYSEPLIPVFSSEGKIRFYERAINPEALGELKYNSNLAELLGIKLGRAIEQETALQFNSQLIKTLYDMYNTDKRIRPNSYINLFKSKDPIVKDALSLLSGTVKQEIEDTFGKGTFMVRADLVNDVIGERMASVSDFYTGKTRWSPSAARHMQKIFNIFLGKDAYKKLVVSEQFAQNVASNLRNTVVVKSFVVPTFNILANVLQLHMKGISVLRIASQIPKKIAEIESYIKLDNKIVELELDKISTSNNHTLMLLDRKIEAFRRAQSKLSIYPLIEAGEFSSIADVGLTTEDLELTKGHIGEYIEKQIDRLPSGAIKTIVKYGYLSKDTALYQGLLKSMQYGDFVAKAILYDFLTNIKKKSQQEALNQVADEFVDYDRQTGRTRGYIESINLLAFGNYKLRACKAALALLKYNPLQSLLYAASPISFLDRIGSPLSDSLVPSLLTGKIFNTTGLIDNTWNQLFSHPILNLLF